MNQVRKAPCWKKERAARVLEKNSFLLFFTSQFLSPMRPANPHFCAEEIRDATTREKRADDADHIGEVFPPLVPFRDNDSPGGRPRLTAKPINFYNRPKAIDGPSAEDRPTPVRPVCALPRHSSRERRTPRRRRPPLVDIRLKRIKMKNSLNLFDVGAAVSYWKTKMRGWRNW